MKKIIALIGVLCLCLTLYAGAITYGEGKFVACTSQGKIYTSPDGAEWTERPSPVAVDIRSIAYGNGKFVAITRPVESAILISPDGISWTKRASGADYMMRIKFVNGRFVIFGTNSLIMDSTDGINWNINYGAKRKAFSDIIYVNGRYIICGFNSIGSSTSLAGFSLKKVSDNPTGFSSIAFGNGKYVFCGGAVTSKDPKNNDWTLIYHELLMYSIDGEKWNKIDTFAGRPFHEVLFDGSRFIVLAEKEKMLVSADAQDWQYKNMPLGHPDSTRDAQPELIFENGTYVMMFNIENGMKIYTSTDLNNWTAR